MISIKNSLKIIWQRNILAHRRIFTGIVPIKKQHSFGIGSTLNRFLTATSGLEVPIITKTKASKATRDQTGKQDAEWLAWVKSLPHMEVERELHGVKKVMGAHYSQGNYEAALDSALKLEDIVSSTIGKDNAVYASCVNNIALMNKMLGHKDAAMNKYTEALHLYEKAVGKVHSSYAAILSNIGILYRSMSEDAKGMERLRLLDRAEEALADALATRILLAPDQKLENSRDALSAAMNLAMVHRLRDSAGVLKGEESLRNVLNMTRRTCGNDDSLTAMVLSNLGILLKGSGKHAEAMSAYSEALDIRSKTLGDAHPDTIVSMHNLAELHLAMGDQAQSSMIQESIIKILEKSRNLKVPTEGPPPASPAPPQPESRVNNDTASIPKKEPVADAPPIATFVTRKKKA